MFRLLINCFKLSALVIAILVLGNWLSWDGRTISDHVRSRMSHAQRAGMGDTLKGWADHAWEKSTKAVAEFGEEATEGVRKPTENRPQSRKAGPAKESAGMAEEILLSERQKLRDLIRELNGNRHNDEKQIR